MDELTKKKLEGKVMGLSVQSGIVRGLTSALPKNVIFNVTGPVVTIPEFLVIGQLLEQQTKLNMQLCELLETLVKA